MCKILKVSDAISLILLTCRVGILTFIELVRALKSSRSALYCIFPHFIRTSFSAKVSYKWGIVKTWFNERLMDKNLCFMWQTITKTLENINLSGCFLQISDICCSKFNVIMCDSYEFNRVFTVYFSAANIKSFAVLTSFLAKHYGLKFVWAGLHFIVATQSMTISLSDSKTCFVVSKNLWLQDMVLSSAYL